ncbi:uncharacterized protein [Mytilus edulis]|uniref:uncharacterized protein n=1 Tax=Mytilus edulis TaxID=6550 RepID=UPI0039EFE874
MASTTANTSTTPGAEPETEPETEPEASAVEIIVPPVALAFCGILVLLTLYILTKKIRCCRRDKRIHCNDKLQEVDNTFLFLEDFESERNDIPKDPFFTEYEVHALGLMSHFQNSVRKLVFISVPPLLGLIFCPMTLFIYSPMANYFWPSDSSTPNINDALGCFLVPAGMVYAITFGYAIEEVQQKHFELRDRLSEEVVLSREIICMVNQIEAISLKARQKLCRILKTNIMNRILQAQNNFDGVDENVNVWEIADILNYSSMKQTATTKALLRVVFENVHRLFSLIPDNGPLHEHINPLQWMLLETLGGFTFLGMLMVKAQSYRMELTICLISVISITLLVFTVSDLDSPFDGFFRIDLSPMEAVVCDLYKEYRSILPSKSASNNQMKLKSSFAPFGKMDKS